MSKVHCEVLKKEMGSGWNPDNMVFLTVYGNFYAEQYLNSKFKKFAKKIGLPDGLHIHSLRHTTASLLINSDVSPKLVAEQLGHASASITQDIYSHIFQSSKALIDSLEDSALTELLSSFSCAKDADIEYFLHRRTREFEDLSKARTYLIFDEGRRLRSDGLSEETSSVLRGGGNDGNEIRENSKSSC